MGNTLNQNPIDNLCQSNVLPSSILAQTSLHPMCQRQCMKAIHHSSSADNKDVKMDTPDSTVRDKVRLSCSESKAPERQRSGDKHILTENDFHILKILGVEGFGKMYLVRKDDNGKLYTMKTIDKRKIASLGCIDSIESERLILEKANHPFIPKLKYTFENDKKIFFVFDHIEGEKLNIVLRNLTKFSEEITRFYTAEIITTLEYLHNEMKTSYQDLETDHIRLDNEGHINLTDFAKSKSLDLDKDSNKENSNKKLDDFYHLGCLIYELLAGEKIVGSECIIKDLVWPKHVSKTARDLITRLLSLKSEEKLGFNDIEEIKKHQFFDGIKWEKIEQKLMYPPISPPKGVDKYDNKGRHDSCFSFNSPYSSSCELDEIMERQAKNNKPDIIKRRIMI